MKTTTMKMVLGSMAACFAFGVQAVDPTITDVTVRQRWPWSRLVDIDYVLTCDTADRMDIALTAYNSSTALTLPNESLAGDNRYGISQGAHHIVWDPSKTAYTNDLLTQFRVNLTVTNSPVYMIVDLTKSAGTDGQIEYVYRGDARLETDGRWTNVWFDVTNDSTYATDKLVLRRISAGTFKMGSSVPPTISTTLTKDFYAGVFEVTQRQWELIMGNNPSFYINPTYYASRPVDRLTYDEIRGATNGTPIINWPTTGHTVSPSSFIGQLRSKTGLPNFDLPTEAQWEYLCRAGTVSVFNDGIASANVSGVNANTNEWLNLLGRYRFNGGYIDGVTKPTSSASVTNGTTSVGNYTPNGWGLYDTLGNLWEWVLDWNGTQTGNSDPVGAISGSGRLIRGGSWDNTASLCTSAYRYGDYVPSIRNNIIGFRLVMPLP